MNISKRGQGIEFSAIRMLTPYADQAVRQGKKVYHLNIGAPDVETPQAFFDAVRNFEEKTLAYAPSKGFEALRKATSNYYKSIGIDFDMDEIYITQGASEALDFALTTCIDVGDEIITCDPYYSNYQTYLDLTGAVCRTFETKVEDGYRLPAKKDIEKILRPRSRAFLLSNPGNPTGAVYTKEEIQMIAEIAIERDMFIIADEVYREFVYDGEVFYSFANVKEIEDRLVLLDSISKRFSACGARIGSLACKNKKVLECVNKLCNGRLSVSTLDQYGAAELYNTDKSYFQEVNKQYQKRRDVIYQGLIDIPGVKVEKTKGAFYIFPEFPVEDTLDFAKWLLTDFELGGETVMVAPGQGFYRDPEKGKTKLRLAFVINEQDIKKSVKILKAGLEEYQRIKSGI
ncbi:aminotransferase, class I/II [Clostridiales bacterium KA00134]|nr:aminotransferase, class I/II [Clostridiales bacterium KA00134]